MPRKARLHRPESAAAKISTAICRVSELFDLDRVLENRLCTNRLSQDAPAFQFRDDTGGCGIEIGGAAEDDIRIRRWFFFRFAHVDGDDGCGMDESSDRLRGFAIGKTEGIRRGHHDQAGVGEESRYFTIAASHLRRLATLFFAEIRIEPTAKVFAVQ